MAPGFGALLALASAIPILVLGAALLVPRPRRTEQIAFGLFAILWGLQVLLADLVSFVDAVDVARTTFLLSHALIPPATLALALFAARTHGGRWTWLIPAGLGVVAGLAAVVLVADPGTVVRTATGPDGGEQIALGPASLPLFGIPLFGVFYLALAAVYLRYRRAPAGSPRHRYRSMVLALALFTSYQTVANLLIFLGVFQPAPSIEGVGDSAAAGVFVLGTAFLLGLVVHLAVEPPEPEDVDGGLLLSFLVPAGTALVIEAFWPGSHVWGLFRLLTVAVLVRAIAREQLFDLDLKLKRWAGPTLAALVVSLTALGALTLALGGAGLVATSGSLAAGLVGAGMLMVSRQRIGEAFFAEAEDVRTYRRQRKREVYQAALERVLDEGDPDQAADDPVLADLRDNLGISEAQHSALLAQVAGQVPREQGDRLEHVEPGATVAGRYHVERLIGEGGHGRAFLAHDEAADREVVLKVVGRPLLGGRAARRLVREAEMLEAIEHPNVLDVHDVLEGRHEVVLVTEYAGGGSLGDLLARRGRLGLSEVARLADEVLAGLGAAHAEGIVHRDIKPDNVLRMRDGTYRLADFGVARDGGEGTQGLTAGPVGTLLYMSPEQVRGDEVDERTDLYAVGVVLHRCLTGGFYVKTAGADDFALRQRILEDPPELDLGDHPDWVGSLVERALAKDPGDRFASADEMRAALEI